MAFLVLGTAAVVLAPAVLLLSKFSKVRVPERTADFGLVVAGTSSLLLVVFYAVAFSDPSTPTWQAILIPPFVSLVAGLSVALIIEIQVLLVDTIFAPVLSPLANLTRTTRNQLMGSHAVPLRSLFTPLERLRSEALEDLVGRR